ncbi:hypothetical protein Cni_G19075 [Canna indica]|uniref:Uncharacterized protein n=1 Tax=Canna indica TaxID=4628 RepID=A0AAQ3QJE2_9LILI|nr:hypothetical protein Cni_G19075 [Canna indica]
MLLAQTTNTKHVIKGLSCLPKFHIPGFGELVDTYELLKLGGLDYHGRGGHDECDLGSVNLPLATLYDFLKMA